MTNLYINEPMLDMFIFETSQLIGQLEKSILSSEKSNCYTLEGINEIFRIMHTIKGSAAMMMFNDIATLAHSTEDLFYFLREKRPKIMDCSILSDLVLDGVDFIKMEVEKIKKGEAADGVAEDLIKKMKDFLSVIKQHNSTEVCIDKNVFQAIVYFELGCEMENIRAYTLIRNLSALTQEVFYEPENILEDDDSIEYIRQDGFKIIFRTEYSYEKIHEFFEQTIFLRELQLIQLEGNDKEQQFFNSEQGQPKNAFIETGDIYKEVIPKEETVHRLGEEYTPREAQSAIVQQSIISVSVPKLDKLMDLVGEMVIAEAMVIQNPDLKGLELDNFQKAARQLSKITGEMQDMVMSIRMVPLSATFHKMHRIVRDMCKKLGKEVNLEIMGEETEVDKNIIEHISDPLMHLVRNALDHGIEFSEDRLAKGKSQAGTITLEAKNAGSDVLVILKDDGKGLSKEKILKKAKENSLLHKPETEMSDKEIFNLIFLPGFSTKENITEFSGRGVGMDVVTKNIEMVGGAVSVDSMPDSGTTITLKIPLTLAIIDGMNIKVGDARYTIPTVSIKESFRPKEDDIITDPEGNEMIMVRGQCYPVLRIHEHFKVETSSTQICEGIIIMAQQEDKTLCIFADELLGQQQVVVKGLPEYIKKIKKIKGLAGCTLLGDGSISLILDIAGMIGL
jgi:two-component system chemotaxis sensor kinase CheA